MRKALSCVLMMTLLLSGCKAGSAGEGPEALAARIRGEYLNLERWTAVMSVRADYGERVYDFTLDVSWERDGDTRIKIVEPEIVAGIGARVGKDGGYLEYDGISLSTGPLTGEGLDPLEAVPFLMDRLTVGYMSRCSYVTEGERLLLLLVECRDPELPEGSGTGCALYLDPDSHDLVRAELSRDGAAVLTVTFKEFTKEMNSNGSTDRAHMG